jgi:hypothetical protein
MLCEVVKDCYFCTRINKEVLTQTDKLPKLKKLFKKVKKRFG